MQLECLSMRTIHHASKTFSDDLAAFCRGSVVPKEISDSVAGILADVRGRGDEAVSYYAAKFDSAKLRARDFSVKPSDLAAAALATNWQTRQPELDAIFSPTIPPLERLRRFCELGYEHQKELKKQHGCVMGCPLFTLGAEVCNQESKLHKYLFRPQQNYTSYDFLQLLRHKRHCLDAQSRQMQKEDHLIEPP